MLKKQKTWKNHYTQEFSNFTVFNNTWKKFTSKPIIVTCNFELKRSAVFQKLNVIMKWKEEWGIIGLKFFTKKLSMKHDYKWFSLFMFFNYFTFFALTQQTVLKNIFSSQEAKVKLSTRDNCWGKNSRSWYTQFRRKFFFKRPYPWTSNPKVEQTNTNPVCVA